MGIMPAAFDPGGTVGKDPFTEKIPLRGQVTHGQLPENRNHGGDPFGLPNASQLKSGALARGPVSIDNFLYGKGDLNRTGAAGRPPTVKQGTSLAFLNKDEGGRIMHTITACKSPCNRSTGIAYPLANGPVTFDSGNLGYGPTYGGPAKQEVKWSTPKNLRTGTYTYFCRVHPFMRGAFRVVKK